MAEVFDRKRLAPLKDTVAVVGVGETDYVEIDTGHAWMRYNSEVAEETMTKVSTGDW